MTEERLEERAGGRRGEIVAAWAALLLGYLFWHAAPVYARPLAGALLLCAIYGGTAIWVKRCGYSLRPVWAPVLGGVLCTSLLLSSGFAVRFLSFWGALAVYAWWVLCLCGGTAERRPGRYLVAELWKALAAVPFRSIGKLFPTLAQTGGQRRRFLRVFLYVAGGLAAAVIPCVMVYLLLSYDNSFTSLFSSIFRSVFTNALSEIWNLVFAVPVAMYLFGLIYGNLHGRGHASLTAERVDATRVRVQVLPPVAVVAAILPLVTMYILFFVSQWEMYLSAFTGVLPKAYSLSEYARNGFFELCAVAAVNAAVMLLVGLFLRRKDPVQEPLLRVILSVMSVLTLVLLATAFSKMILYIQSYGLTQLRVYTSVFMLVLAVGFLLTLLRQFLRRMNLPLALWITVIVSFCAFAVSNPDARIAEYNVRAYEAGDLETVDVDAMTELEESAVPSLVRLARQEGNTPLGQAAQDWLEDFCENPPEKYTPFFSWSIPVSSADHALREAELSRNWRP